MILHIKMHYLLLFILFIIKSNYLKKYYKLNKIVYFVNHTGKISKTAEKFSELY